MGISVRPKKRLGQHFLTDINIAAKIAASVEPGSEMLLEIGPGMGALTGHLLPVWGEKLWLVEIDEESVTYLTSAFPSLEKRIVHADFLKLDLEKFFDGKAFSVIGNFPYNISTQILFKAIECRKQVKTVAGMFQKEVAKRICSPPGNKSYGILSVLVQAYFNTAYLFDVPPSVFVPPPEVDSGVIKLVKKENFELGCNDEMFMRVVKMAFNQRRKKLSNALSAIISGKKIESEMLAKRAEQLAWTDFVTLTKLIDTTA